MTETEIQQLFEQHGFLVNTANRIYYPGIIGYCFALIDINTPHPYDELLYIPYPLTESELYSRLEKRILNVKGRNVTICRWIAACIAIQITLLKSEKV